MLTIRLLVFYYSALSFLLFNHKFFSEACVKWKFVTEVSNLTTTNETCHTSAAEVLLKSFEGSAPVAVTLIVQRSAAYQFSGLTHQFLHTDILTEICRAFSCCEHNFSRGRWINFGLELKVSLPKCNVLMGSFLTLDQVISRLKSLWRTNYRPLT